MITVGTEEELINSNHITIIIVNYSLNICYIYL